MGIKDELLDTIEMMVNKSLDKYSQDSQNRVVSCAVTGIVGGKYKVNIDGADYLVKDGIGLGVNIGAQVWIMIPNGNIGQGFVFAKR